VVKWDSSSERDWRIFLNSEVALTVFVDGVSFLITWEIGQEGIQKMRKWLLVTDDATGDPRGLVDESLSSAE
jgi:hypothetical protein